MTHMELTDVNGKTWVGDTDPSAVLTAEDRAQIDELLTDWKALDFLSLEVDGRKHYFNPANIVGAVLVEDI